MNVTLTDGLRTDIETLWDYNQLGHEPRPCDIVVGLGSHDIGVATWTAQLYHRGLVPRIVFTGANAPTTLGRFPRGEAVHCHEHALELGVPAEVILLETRARNTGQNIDYTRRLLADARIEVRSAIMVSRPYQQRRVFATCQKLWPELKVICTSLPRPLDEYLDTIGDAKLAIDTMVGDTQRHELFAQRGYTIPQMIPDPVRAAYHRLIDAGFTSRLLPDPQPAAKRRQGRSLLPARARARLSGNTEAALRELGRPIRAGPDLRPDISAGLRMTCCLAPRWTTSRQILGKPERP